MKQIKLVCASAVGLYLIVSVMALLRERRR